MLNRSTLASVALVAVGAALGWASATGQVNLSRLAGASAEPSPPAPFAGASAAPATTARNGNAGST